MSAHDGDPGNEFGSDLPAEAPEADSLEQREGLAGGPRPTAPLEADEGDVLEQFSDVADADDDYPHGDEERGL